MSEEEEQSLTSVIYQAVGEASTCWDTLEGAGVFDSNHAAEIAKSLTLLLSTRIAVGVESICVCEHDDQQCEYNDAAKVVRDMFKLPHGYGGPTLEET